MPRDNEKEKDKKQGGKNGSQVSLRDPTFGVPEPQPDGTFQVGFTASVYWGSKLAWGEILWRPRVNGKSIIGFQIVVSGRIEYRFIKLSGEKASLAIDLKYGEWERTVPLREIELLKLKRKLEIVSTLHHDDQLEVVLRRVGKDGKPETGDIVNWDFEEEEGKAPTWSLFRRKIDPGKEDIWFKLECRKNSRAITFLLPDDKDVKVGLEIPAKKVVKQPSVVETQQKYDPFLEGRNAFRKLVGKEPLTPLRLDVDWGSWGSVEGGEGI